MESIGKRLKRVRGLMGFSQADIAKRTSVRRETIGRWEREQNVPQPICFKKLDGMLRNYEAIIELSDKL